MKKLSTRWLTNSLIVALGAIILVATALLSYNYFTSSASGSCKFIGFKQTASPWGEKKYGLNEFGKETTIAIAGCGPTAITSVMRYYVPYGFAYPDAVADYFLRHSDSAGDPCRINGSGTNSNCFKTISLAWGFGYNKISYAEAVTLLKKGKPIIALVGCGGRKTQDRTRYTGCPNGGHYIVLTKLSGSTVSIWDPNKDNTSDNINNFADATGYLRDGFWYIYR